VTVVSYIFIWQNLFTNIIVLVNFFVKFCKKMGKIK